MADALQYLDRPRLERRILERRGRRLVPHAPTPISDQDSVQIGPYVFGLRDAARRGSLPLTIVLTEVTLLASAGLRTLYEHAGNFLSAKRSIRLVAPDTSLARDVLAISGLDEIVDVVAELD